MSFTRREMCLLLPALLPVAAELQAFAQDKSLPSGAFSFDKAPLHVANNNAQIRMMLAWKAGYGRGHRSAPDHAASGGRAHGHHASSSPL